MAYPKPPQVSTSYTAKERELGDGSLPGQELDVDFANFQGSIEDLIGFLRGFTRADGQLANGSVGAEQLSSDLAIGFEPPSPWETGVSYSPGETVFHQNKFYMCEIAHTSSDFQVDFDAGRWRLLADFTEELQDAIDAANAAAASEAAAAGSAAAASASETAAAGHASAAAGSETAAAGSASAAATSAGNAAASETAADGSAVAAAASAAAAASSATTATDEAAAAALSASNAGASETNAADSEAKARKWAEEAEGVEVEPGEYSAYHWAQQAYSYSSFDPADYYDKTASDSRFATAAQGVKADEALPAAEAGILSGFRNKIINGDLTGTIPGFPINQRNHATPLTPGIGVYGYDRWKGHADGLEQICEGLEAGEYTLTWTGGGNGRLDGGSLQPSPIKATVSAGNVSVVVPTTAGRVSLVKGDATAEDDPFSPRHIQQEKNLCQRYFRKVGQGCIGQTTSTTGGLICYSHEPMRATPTASSIPGSGANAGSYFSAGVFTMNTISGTPVGDRGGYMSIGGSGYPSGALFVCMKNTLNLDAEI